MTVQKKKKPAAKKPVKKQTEETRHASKQMWAVVLFAVGILVGALTYFKGDRLWQVIYYFMRGVFSWSVFFFAPLIIYVAVIAAMDRPLSTIKNKLWQVCVLIVMISSAIQIFGAGMPNEGSFGKNIALLYEQGKYLESGGVASALLSFPLLSLFGKTGAGIIIILCIFVFAMLVTGSTLIGLFKLAARPAKELEDAYVATVESRETRRQERAAQPPKAAVKPARFAYDIDISGDKPVPPAEDAPPWDEETPKPDLPEHPVRSKKPTSKERLLGMASPVEYISPEEFAPSPPQEQPEPEPEKYEPPRHSLDDDILRAERETDDDIDSIIDRFMSGDLDEAHKALTNEYAFPLKNDNTVRPDSIPAFADPPAENKPPYVYKHPAISLLSVAKAANSEDITEELKQNAQTLVDTLKSFGVQTRITDICRGPAVTRYELQPSAGVKISKITGLSDDIALNLASAGIRIEAPIPNKAAVGIEVPNKVVSTVSIREILDSGEFNSADSSVSVALGKDIAGNIILADIGKMPHVLIAGSTGSGKSVCINSIIISLLYKSSPEDVKLLMVDPKVVELGIYNGIPHLLVPVVTDPKKAAGALNWAVVEMLRRYKEFADHSVRDLAGYNRLAESDDELKPMPKIVIIIDELADLMMAAPNEVEDSICRLAQMARAAGMHLVIATQRPSVDVITGVIKANIPSRVAFAVSSQVDSRTILDMGGAEKLLGRGDMLFYPVGASKPQRVQGCFVTDTEVEKVVEFIKAGENTEYDQQIVEEIDRHVVADKSGKDKDSGGGFDDEDEMLPQAIECVVEAGMASTSQLQRRLKLGYARAARIIDQLEERGIVGPFEGSKPRQVLISKERWLEMKLSGAEQMKIKEFSEF